MKNQKLDFFVLDYVEPSRQGYHQLNITNVLKLHDDLDDF